MSPSLLLARMMHSNRARGLCVGYPTLSLVWEFTA